MDSTSDAGATSPHCDACRKPLEQAPASRVFPTWHVRCLERAVEDAREEHAPEAD